VGRIRQVSDEDDLVDWHRVDAAAHGADYFALPADPVQELGPRLAGDFYGERRELWSLESNGRVVAVGEIALPIHDNLSSASVDLRVDPPSRGRGHGRRLLECLLSRVGDHSRSRIFFEVGEALPPEPGGGPDFTVTGNRLARHTGARPVQSDIRRLLDLTEQAAVRTRRVRPGPAGGYSLVQWQDHTPEELLDDLAALHARMSTDPPLGAMDWEPEVWNAARVRERDATARRRGRWVMVTAARHDPSGRLAGYTDIEVSSLSPQVAYQFDTIVAPEHRGHGLGLAMKLANLQRLRDSEPATRYVNTWNAASNVHMVAINEALGFRPVERWWEWQLDR
jgi:GNAT superfamily N-acetyltransferase